MNKITRFFIMDCHKASECCNKAQYDEANSIEKLKLRLHHYLCKTCKKFSEKNSKLTGMIQKSDIKRCPDHYKNGWKEEISKQNENLT